MSFNQRRPFYNNGRPNNFNRQNNFERQNHQAWQNNLPPPVRDNNIDLLGNLGLGNFQNFDRIGNFSSQNLNRPRNNINFRNENRSLSSDYIRFNQFRNFDRNHLPPPEKRLRTESYNPPSQNFNRSPAPQRKPVSKPKGLGQNNSFAKFRNLEEFKDYRKSLKIKSTKDNELNDEDRTPDFIFISPTDIQELKDDIYIALRRKPANLQNEVEEICRAFSRFQYHLSFKEYKYAKEYSKKKAEPPNERNFFSCNNCDCFFTSKDVLNIHINSNFHNQVSKIASEVLIIGKEYIKKFNEPKELLVNCPISEKVGILVCLTDSKLDYSKLDVKSMDEDSFVLAALEEKMKIFWPYPKSQYFCRCCNYSEFVSQALLDRHLQSARHLEFDRHYSEAFCIVCQHHYGDTTEMKKHQETKEHEKASHLMDFTRKQAIEYWKYWHFKDQNVIVEKTQKSLVNQNTKGVIIINSVEDKKELVKKEQEVLFQVPFLAASESPSRLKTELKVIDLENSSKITTDSAIRSSSSSVSIEKNPSKSDLKDTKTSNAQDLIHIKDHDNDNKGSNSKDPTDLDIKQYKNYLSSKNASENQSPVKEEVMREKPIEDEKSKVEFDEYIVPLTGYMCTVCHETLADKTKASAHKETNSHKSNIKTHEVLFG